MVVCLQNIILQNASGLLWYCIQEKRIYLEIQRTYDPNVSGKEFSEVGVSSLHLKVIT